jgi:asparagine N-glycosylation enzyme membrane subunit Stt3
LRLSPFARAFAAVILPAAAMFSVPAIRNGLSEGGGFLGGDRWLSTIAEFRPYFNDPPTRWLDALLLAPLVVAVPLAVTARRRGETGRLAIALFAIAYGAMAISSRRFAYIAVPLAALAGALAFDMALRLGRRSAAIWVAVLVVVAPAIATAIYIPLMKERPDVHTEATIRAALALRQLPASGRILAPWDRGHLIAFYGGRAAVVDNFGSVERRSELTAAAAALLATDDAALLRYCRERGVAYIVLNHPIEQLAATATIAGLDGDRYARGRSWIERGPDAESTFWWRAYFGGERAAIAGVPQPKPVRGFRLVWRDEMDVGYAFGLRGDAAQVWAVE